MEEFLSRVSYKATISESSPEGDKVLTTEELAITPTMPPFSLAPGSQGLCYAQLTGIQENLSACEVWSWFGGRNGTSKGVVLPVRKTTNKGCIAYVAFDSLDKCDKVVEHPDSRFVGNWFHIHEKSEQEILNVFSRSLDDYIIKVSTESGMDRNLEPAEEKLIRATKVESTEPAGTKTATKKVNGEHPEDKPAENQGNESKEDSANEPGLDVEAAEQCATNVGEDVSMNSQTDDGVLTKSVKGKSAGPPKKIKQEFYIRLKNVPADVKTASDILLLFNAGESHAKSATLVCDADGVGVSAYVMFDELEQRDSVLSQQPFSVRCTEYGRAVRLAEFESDHEIFECIEGGHDRVLSMEERESLEEQFNGEN